MDPYGLCKFSTTDDGFNKTFLAEDQYTGAYVRNRVNR